MRHWQPCRVCGRRHTNPASSSICPECGTAERAEREKVVEVSPDDEAIFELQKILSRSDDTEADHSAADQVLIKLLRNLGYETVADLWEQVPKWYA